MVALKEFSASGVQVSDEVVRCNEAVQVGGSTYYRGYLANTPNANIYGNDSPTCGAWSAAGKTGTRYFVLSAGYPATSSQVAVDLRSGWVWSLAQATYYVCYLAHQPIKHNTNNVQVEVPYVLTAGQSITLEQLKFPYFAKFGYALIDVQGGAPSADATLTVSNGTESASITVSASQNPTITELAAPLKITTAETLTLSTADGKGAYGISIKLMDV